jgi:hypothetical protein
VVTSCLVKTAHPLFADGQTIEVPVFWATRDVGDQPYWRQGCANLIVEIGHFPS